MSLALMVTHGLLSDSLHAYQSSYQEELDFKVKFIELLAHPRAFFRDHLPGHITASSWIVDRTRKFTLLTHHAKLNRWLQPGGHADGVADVIYVAHQEAFEETGLTVKLLLPEIFDIDIHSIPSRKDFPEHQHYDIRFLFEGDADERLTISDESINLSWTPIDEIAAKSRNNRSMLRMAEKVKKLFRTDQQ